MYEDFLSATNSPHALDAYTKQAMAIALSVAMRCEPCLKMHLKGARAKGFTQEEIDEAAWSSLYATVSRPFNAPSTGRIAVKVINHYGDEVLRVYECGTTAEGTR